MTTRYLKPKPFDEIKMKETPISDLKCPRCKEDTLLYRGEVNTERSEEYPYLVYCTKDNEHFYYNHWLGTFAYVDKHSDRIIDWNDYDD